MAILLALVSEVAAIRERLDSHERLGESKTFAAGVEVEAYRPTETAEADRETWRDAYLKRLFRVITEDVEQIADNVGMASDDVD